MITEFTCGIYTAIYKERGGPQFDIKANTHTIAFVCERGATIKFASTTPYLTEDCLIEIAVLMNNIKRQYKQLQTN